MKPLISCVMFIVILCSGCASQNEENILKVALLIPVSHPSMDKISKGFIDALNEEKPERYRVDIYNAQGNKTLMRSEIEQIARSDYALVLTVGTSASKMAIELLPKKNTSLPIVFTAVHDPEILEIASEGQSQRAAFTGIRELLNFEEELDSLLKYKPYLTTLLLVYNSTEPGLRKDKEQIEAILNRRHIALKTVEVFQSNELHLKVPPFMEEADALLVLKDNTVITGLDLLVKLCENYHIPLIASDLDSPNKGAAFGYGVEESEFGRRAAKQALEILRGQLSPGEIPIEPVSDFQLIINPKAALRQGIEAHKLLDEEVQ